MNHHHKWRRSRNDDTADLSKREDRLKRFDQPIKSANKYGLVSRGLELILQHSQRERQIFFNHIIECFIRYCSTSLVDDWNIEIPTSPVESTEAKETKSQISSPVTTSTTTSESLQDILSDLRKLRELLIANPFTDFTRQVFLFSMRISSNIGHYQSYFPSAIHLLANEECLSPLEVQEVATVMVLHLSHHNNANGSALIYYYKYLNDDHRLLQVLTSWIGCDYYLWIRIYNGESNPYKLRLMRFGLKRMLAHLIQCLEKLYFTLPSTYMDEILPNGITLMALEDDYGVHWKRQNNTLIIRERKSVSKP